ncbi:MAG: hypothetical protein IKX84_06560 [Clostridia bacterium]|nr:hypothetical protein [Clostridia bacterium]
MFIPWHDASVRLTGRWSRLDKDESDPHIFTKPTARFTTTTAAGSYFEIAFEGHSIVLLFDLGYLGQPFPHLWIQLDGGANVEAPVDRYLRVDAGAPGRHTLRVSYKGGMEMLPRWHQPLMGAVSFVGYRADAPAALEKDERRIIEFIGDSITEGVLIDADFDSVSPNTIDQFNRPYQDDSAATYASLTAKKMNLRPIFQAYGAVGLTRQGCGSVPRAGLIYPWVFEHVPYTGEKPDYVVINHGANDRGTDAGEYLMRYEELIDMVHDSAPKAEIVCLGAFCGAFDEELSCFVSKLNRPYVHFVSTRGWLPAEPLHPLRDGHMIAAERLTEALRTLFLL